MGVIIIEFGDIENRWRQCIEVLDWDSIRLQMKCTFESIRCIHRRKKAERNPEIFDIDIIPLLINRNSFFSREIDVDGCVCFQF